MKHIYREDQLIDHDLHRDDTQDLSLAKIDTMLKGKRGGQLHQNGHNLNSNAGVWTTTGNSKHCHDRPPLMPTMTHAPTAPPQPPPSATMTTTKALGESLYPVEGVTDDVAH
jgi:hypothetical protein